MSTKWICFAHREIWKMAKNRANVRSKLGEKSLKLEAVHWNFRNRLSWHIDIHDRLGTAIGCWMQVLPAPISHINSIPFVRVDLLHSQKSEKNWSTVSIKNWLIFIRWIEVWVIFFINSAISVGSPVKLWNFIRVRTIIAQQRSSSLYPKVSTKSIFWNSKPKKGLWR